jgi:chemotaxis regulatin CheY-phosphate phosphatase CheZ
MVEMATPGTIREDDFEAILVALSETERGRSFLSEYIRRQQKPDTQVVLEAIARLEKTMTRERAIPSIDRIRLDIADMQEAIERTKREIANIKHESDDGNRFVEASNELDAIVTKTEAATQEILAAAEAIQEHAWTLREAGADEAACDDIDARATEIFMACSFQDLTGQRTQKIVNVLQYLESRINMMISIWGIEGSNADEGAYLEDSRPDAHLLNGPQLDGRGVSQNTVDEMFGPTDGDQTEDTDGAAQESAGDFAGTTASADEIDALFAEDDADAQDAGSEPMNEDDISALFDADTPATVEADDFDDLVMIDSPAVDDVAFVDAEDADEAAADEEMDMEALMASFDAPADGGEDDMAAAMAADNETETETETDTETEVEPEAKATADNDTVADAVSRQLSRMDDEVDGDDPLEELSAGERQALFS